MNSEKNVFIIGGGQAGIYAASEFRKIDKETKVTILGEENFHPYERPPLSKEFLINSKKEGEFLFFSENFFEEQKINYIFEKIEKVNFQNKELVSKNNKYIYDKLLITTGSTNKKLQINKEIDSKIFYLRSLEEAKKIKNEIQDIKKIVIIGGGFIGLEIASSLNQQNKSVTLIEISQQLMGRIIPAPIANLVKDEHEKYGNKIYLNRKIKNINKVKDGFEIILDNEEIIHTEMVIAGIGSVPTVDLFNETDLKLKNGILTDEFNQTSIKDVYAAGDVTNFYHPLFKNNLRLESYQHAQNHGINAGKNIAGLKTSYSTVPWMWSDQFNFNLQLTGLCDEYDEALKRGDSLENGIVYFFIKKNKIIGACGLGVSGKIGRDIRISSKLIEKNTDVDKNILLDENIKLNSLLKK
jgi:3-phenylpropionate/trans-cinnamate dioxygenase ferredoxin reductase subunit